MNECRLFTKNIGICVSFTSQVNICVSQTVFIDMSNINIKYSKNILHFQFDTEFSYRAELSSVTLSSHFELVPVTMSNLNVGTDFEYSLTFRVAASTPEQLPLTQYHHIKGETTTIDYLKSPLGQQIFTHRICGGERRRTRPVLTFKGRRGRGRRY